MKKGRREEEAFKVWILVKELYGICVWICMEFMWVYEFSNIFLSLYVG